MSPDIDESIRCTASSCACVRFKPGNVQLRTCDRCGHGWVAHALEKLQVQPPSSCGPVEVALPGLVFDLSSLILYGAQAVPVRLKILLDRLYSVLTPEQVSHILHTLGWSLGDYVRGYMLQCPSGKVLDRWFMATQDEELLILRQFFRFGETRPIVELMSLRLSDAELNAPNSCQTFAYVERSGRPAAALRSTGADSCLVAGISRLGRNSPADHSPVQLFKAFPDRQSSFFPVALQASEARCLVPSTKELVPSSKPSSYLLKPSGTNVTEQRRVQEKGSVLPQSNGELALTIKVDPDKQLPAQSLWNQHIQPHNKREPDLHRGEAESTSALGPAPSSSSLYPHVSLSTSSTLRASQRLQGSSSLSLHPLPAFSSSFLCPPSSSFSSTLQPLPSSLCSSPFSPAAGRKGRVCCGVCGKSFYDKGTLKIHYNAVHLKIKHRCTVAGCTMVFSSLRSRNRHSANPNPRLHTSSGRHTQTHRNSLVHETKQCHRNIHNTHTRTCRGKALCRDEDAPTLRNRYDTAHASPPPSPHPPPRMLNQENHLSPNDATHRTNLTLQATAPPLLPVRCASSLGSPPSSVHLVAPEVEKPKHCWPRLTQTAPALLSDSLTNCNNQHVSGENTGTEISTSPVANQQQWWESGDSAPKKKPRKSSMPVKIERGNTEGRRNKEEEEC